MTQRCSHHGAAQYQTRIHERPRSPIRTTPKGVQHLDFGNRCSQFGAIKWRAVWLPQRRRAFANLTRYPRTAESITEVLQTAFAVFNSLAFKTLLTGYCKA